MAKVNPVPRGYHTVTPYLAVDGGAKAIDFYTRAFGAEVASRMDGPNGMVMHAELRIGDSLVMVSDQMPEYGTVGPTKYGPVASSLMIYTPDVDMLFNRAVRAGASVVSKVADQFYGDRTGTIRDPFGHRWVLSTHIEDVSEEEMNRRAQKWASGQGA